MVRNIKEIVPEVQTSGDLLVPHHCHIYIYMQHLPKVVQPCNTVDLNKGISGADRLHTSVISLTQHRFH